MQETEKLYRVAVGGEEIGSYSVEELRSYWQGGSLDKNAMYLHEGTRQWRPVSQMFGSVARMPGAGHAPGVPVGPRLARDGTVLVKHQKSRGVYVILGLFLGALGIHNFYAGRYFWGAVQLVVSVTLGWLILPLLAIWAMNLIEVFVVTEDGAGDPMG